MMKKLCIRRLRRDKSSMDLHVLILMEDDLDEDCDAIAASPETGQKSMEAPNPSSDSQLP